MNFCFIHSKGSDGGMCRCICQNVLKASGLRSPDKMPMSILSTSRKSYLQNRWNLREEKGEESLCLWGLVQNRYSWKGYHSTEEKMKEKRQQDLGGKQKEEHLQEEAKRIDNRTLNIRSQPNTLLWSLGGPSFSGAHAVQLMCQWFAAVFSPLQTVTRHKSGTLHQKSSPELGKPMLPQSQISCSLL